MTISELIAFAATSFAISLSGALEIGPVYISTMLSPSRNKYLAGPLTVIGHALADAFFLGPLVILLNFIARSLVIETALDIICGMALIYTALRLLKTAGATSIKLQTPLKKFTKVFKYGPVIAGIYSSFLSPNLFFWWTTIGNIFTLKALAMAGLIGAAVFYISHVTSDFAWCTAVSMWVKKGRSLVGNKTYKCILYVSSIFLAFYSVYFIISGVLTILSL